MLKKLTIKDIAVMAKTSTTTVSFYLNGKFNNMSKETKDRIKKVIKENNYIPNVIARSLSNSKTNLIGVLVGDITNSFSSQLVKGIEHNAREKGYQIIIGSSNYNSKNEKSFVEKLLQIGVDGFIIQPTTFFKPNIDSIIKNNKKLVFVDSQLDEDNITSIKTDNSNSVYKCIKEIVKNNYYNKYILIGGNSDKLSTRKERAKGFKEALKNIKHTQIVISDYAKEEEVDKKIFSSLNLNDKTLIFVPNCWLLPTLFKVLNKVKEKIPKNIGILGFDNLEWTDFVTPTITTIVQPAFDEGYIASSKLIEMIENDNKKIDNTTLMCSIQWKDSIYKE